MPLITHAGGASGSGLIWALYPFGNSRLTSKLFARTGERNARKLAKQPKTNKMGAFLRYLNGAEHDMFVQNMKSVMQRRARLFGCPAKGIENIMFTPEFSAIFLAVSFC